jgi:hypothetical protein
VASVGSTWKKQLTTADTANTAEKQDLCGISPITHWVTMKKGLKLKIFAVSAVFAVVELRF